MALATVGDDDYGEDPAVNGMCHCQRGGAQPFLGQDAHLHLYEHGGAAQVAGVHSQALPDLPNGTFDLDQLELTLREAHGSWYHTYPELICLENMHNLWGGRALLLTCLRQGMGALAGAVLAGCREFVAKAWHVQKLLGRGMGQVGVLAAAAHLRLQQVEATLHRDHNAWSFAEGTHALDSPLCSINLAAVETSVVLINVQGAWLSPAELREHLHPVSEEKEETETRQTASVLLLPWLGTDSACLLGTATSQPVTLTSQGESWNLWPGSARRNWP